MKALILLALAFGAAHAQEAQKTFEFKSVPFGASKAELLSKHPSIYCREGDKKRPTEEACFVSERCNTDACRADAEKMNSYAGVKPKSVLIFINDGTFEGVTVRFPASNYESVRQAMQLVYGQGREVTERLQNNSGATFISRTLALDTTDANVTLFERLSLVTESAMVATSTKRDAILRAHKSVRPAADAKDL